MTLGSKDFDAISDTVAASLVAETAHDNVFYCRNIRQAKSLLLMVYRRLAEMLPGSGAAVVAFNKNESITVRTKGGTSNTVSAFVRNDVRPVDEARVTGLVEGLADLRLEEDE